MRLDFRIQNRTTAKVFKSSMLRGLFQQVPPGELLPSPAPSLPPNAEASAAFKVRS
jgi:hypothetical protein